VELAGDEHLSLLKLSPFNKFPNVGVWITRWKTEFEVLWTEVQDVVVVGFVVLSTNIGVVLSKLDGFWNCLIRIWVNEFRVVSGAFVVVVVTLRRFGEIQYSLSESYFLFKVFPNALGFTTGLWLLRLVIKFFLVGLGDGLLLEFRTIGEYICRPIIPGTIEQAEVGLVGDVGEWRKVRGEGIEEERLLKSIALHGLVVAEIFEKKNNFWVV